MSSADPNELWLELELDGIWASAPLHRLNAGYEGLRRVLGPKIAGGWPACGTSSLGSGYCRQRAWSGERPQTAVRKANVRQAVQ